jgi:hypothetical protein
VICPQCRAVNEASSAFCGNCGTSLGRPASRTGSQNSLGQPAMPSGSAAGTAGPPWAPASPGSPGSPGGPYVPGPTSPSGAYVPGPSSGAYVPGPYVPGPPSGAYCPGSPTGAYGPGPTSGPSVPGPPSGPYVPGHSSPSGGFRLDLRRLGRVEQAVGGASLVVLISLFLPWYGVTVLGASYTVSGTSAHWYLVIGLLLALLLIGYLVLQSGWDKPPMDLPIAHAPLLLIGTGLQLLLVFIGFLDKPAGLSWEIGAYLALIAALAAAAPVVVPAIRSWQDSH